MAKNGSQEGLRTLDLLASSAGTDIGMRREENQDSYGIIKRENFQFFIVADGMGGVKGGGIASRLAIATIEEQLAANQSLSIEQIVAATKAANGAIFARGNSEVGLAGMGTTLVGLAFSNDRIIAVNVGDSRAYRFFGDEITQITEDHTLVRELIRAGALKPEQAENHPVSHMLTRSLGPAAGVEVDCFQLDERARDGEFFLLCSDGLYNLVTPEEMGIYLRTKPLEKVHEDLIALANHRGGSDNITVIVISVSSDSIAIQAKSPEQPVSPPVIEMPAEWPAFAPPSMDAPSIDPPPVGESLPPVFADTPGAEGNEGADEESEPPVIPESMEPATNPADTIVSESPELAGFVTADTPTAGEWVIPVNPVSEPEPTPLSEPTPIDPPPIDPPVNDGVDAESVVEAPEPVIPMEPEVSVETAPPEPQPEPPVSTEFSFVLARGDEKPAESKGAAERRRRREERAAEVSRLEREKPGAEATEKKRADDTVAEEKNAQRQTAAETEQARGASDGEPDGEAAARSERVEKTESSTKKKERSGRVRTEDEDGDPPPRGSGKGERAQSPRSFNSTWALAIVTAALVGVAIFVHLQRRSDGGEPPPVPPPLPEPTLAAPKPTAEPTGLPAIAVPPQSSPAHATAVAAPTVSRPAIQPTQPAIIIPTALPQPEASAAIVDARSRDEAQRQHRVRMRIELRQAQSELRRKLEALDGPISLSAETGETLSSYQEKVSQFDRELDSINLEREKAVDEIRTWKSFEDRIRGKQENPFNLANSILNQRPFERIKAKKDEASKAYYDWQAASQRLSLEGSGEAQRAVDRALTRREQLNDELIEICRRSVEEEKAQAIVLLEELIQKKVEIESKRKRTDEDNRFARAIVSANPSELRTLKENYKSELAALTKQLETLDRELSLDEVVGLPIGKAP